MTGPTIDPEPVTRVDPLWDADYLGCVLTGLPYTQCGCQHHLRRHPDPSTAKRTTIHDNKKPAPVPVATCAACGTRLTPGETFEGVFCSWLCSM